MVNTRLAIIPFDSDDYHKALILRAEILRYPLGLELTPEDTADDHLAYHLGAFLENQLIGHVSLKPLTSQLVQLKQMAIQSTYQGRGIGTQLLQYAENQAIADNFQEVRLHARTHAQGFYSKFGYQIQGEQFIEVTIPHILMIKKLP